MSLENQQQQKEAEDLQKILAYRTIQDGKETKGPKCKQCFFDIAWDKDKAISVFGTFRPFETDKEIGHQCMKDNEGNIIKRKGYKLSDDGKKVICTLVSPEGAQQTLSSGGSKTGAAAAADQDILKSVLNEMGVLNQRFEGLTTQFTTFASNQNKMIEELRIIINNYIAHNPFAESLKMIVEEFIKQKNTEPVSAFDLLDQSKLKEREREDQQEENEGDLEL